VPLDNFEGFTIIPMEILHSGLQNIVSFILDLYQSPGEPSYHTKMIVVGFAGVGKTSLIDSLFPLEDSMRTMGTVRRTRYNFSLRGQYLQKFRETNSDIPHRQHLLEPRKWKLENKDEVCGLVLTPLKDNPDRVVEIHFDSEEKREKWRKRILKLISNSATHGIEIQRRELEYELAGEKFKVEISTWDFAGQHDYYNNHHYFLSTRSIFLLLFKLDEDEEQSLKGLEFWFKSLVAHLPPQSSVVTYSLLVVGTFLDLIDISQSMEKEEKVRKLAKSVGLHIPILYFEVSCKTFTNIAQLIKGITTSLSTHSYLGERVPKSYLIVRKVLRELQEERKNFPIAEIETVIECCAAQIEIERPAAIRALKLLSYWGDCVYFDHPKELQSLVILDPTFLTKEVLAQVFNPQMVPNINGGILKHIDLPIFWKTKNTNPDFEKLLPSFHELLCKFEVCFVLKEDLGKPFLEQRSLVPSLLEEKPRFIDTLTPDQEKELEMLDEKKLDEYRLRDLKEKKAATAANQKFRAIWPFDPPYSRRYQTERILKFNIVPPELVSRLFVRLHAHIEEQQVWRFDIVILWKPTDSQAWIRVSLSQNIFEVSVRAPDREANLHLMELIIREVEIVAKNYPGVTWCPAMRSPHARDSFVELSAIQQDQGRPLNDRALVCPQTMLPIQAEMLLIQAGLLEEGKNSKAIPLIVDGDMRDQDGLMKLFDFLDFLNIPTNTIATAYQIENNVLSNAFHMHREMLTKRHYESPSLFKKQDWNGKPDKEKRKEFILHLNNQIRKFRAYGWNDGSKVFVLPMLQGTSENGAWKIAENGFATVATLDEGYYGKGFFSISISTSISFIF